VSDPALAIVKPTESPLARLELACRLLAEARSLDEVKVVVDLAEAARVYARQARLGLEAQNDAAELRLRAERRAGELLATMEKHAGGRPTAQPPPSQSPPAKSAAVDENPSPAVRGFSQNQPQLPRLAELHITYRQSNQWQQLAALPEPIFETHIRTTRARRKELTTAATLKLARQHRGPRSSPAPVQIHDQLDTGDRFDVADAAALPWPDGCVDLLVGSPPYALEVPYAGGDVPDYAAWLEALTAWLAELFRVANPDWGRLCLNVPLDRDLGGWEPVSADTIQLARSAGSFAPGSSGTSCRPAPAPIAAASTPRRLPTSPLPSSPSSFSTAAAGTARVPRPCRTRPGWSCADRAGSGASMAPLTPTAPHPFLKSCRFDASRSSAFLATSSPIHSLVAAPPPR